ncbi:MAG: PilZ domain-containing protein [Calditrichaeota bacterium]|nr:PilZ domain-containing protein [Calditrichota bacterium]
MGEQRKLHRRHLIYYLRVFDRETGEVIGHLINITPEGIMVISENPLETNKTYKLKMDLPSDIFEKTEIEFDAESRWCKKDVNPEFYDTGFSILNLSYHDGRLIERLIDDYGFRS